MKYQIQVLNDFDFDELYKADNRIDKNRLHNSLGFADKNNNKIYVRTTGNPKWDLGTIEHEIDELLAKTSPHELNNIRYKNKTPEIPTPPPPPRLPTAEEMFASAANRARTDYPLAFGAREAALADLARGQAYYQQFQPTSIEEALANQYFANVWPDIERQIKGALSLSGMAYSPILAETLGRERGKLGVDIGQYLSNLGQQRAEYSLNQRLGINPLTMTEPFVTTAMNQANQQAELDYGYQLAKLQAEYANAVAKAKQKQAKIGTLTTAIGAGIGTLLLPGSGGLLPGILGWGTVLGAGAGGALSPLFGGESPSFAPNMSDIISAASIRKSPPFNFGTLTSNSAQPVNTQTQFRLPKLSSTSISNPYQQLGWQWQ